MKALNTALCSYGMSGVVFHGPLLEAHPGFSISKILERNRHESEGKHPGATLVRSYEEILEDVAVELVVVNTPDHLHHEMTARALEAGKHVVVEKPVTLKSDDTDQLIRLAAEKGVMLSVFQNRRWDGDFLSVKKMLESGKLGRLVDFESRFDRFRNYLKNSWKEQATGTGTLYNLGSHLVDQTLQLFGMPERLYCDTRMFREGAETDDSYDLFLYYPTFKCLLRSSYLVRLATPRFSLNGIEGSFRVYGLDPQEEALKTGVIPGTKGWGSDPATSHGSINTDFEGKHLEGPYPLEAGNYMAYYDNIYEHIRDGVPLAVTAEEARDVIRVIEAAYESSRTGQVVLLG